MDIDTIIAEATPVAEGQAASPEAISDNSQPKETQETEADIASKPDEALTQEQLTKREKNRQSHLNSKLAEMRRANRELKAQLEARQVPNNQPQNNTDGKPNVDNFGTWEDYNEALTDWKLEQKLNAQSDKVQKIDQVQKQDYSKALRAQQIETQEAEFAKKTPEYATLINDNQSFFNTLSVEVAERLAEADRPELALYALMKEGKLDDLYDLTPTKLAAELARAEIRAESYLKQPKPTTNAPTPITASRGNAVGGKSIDRMSPDELRNWLQSK